MNEWTNTLRVTENSHCALWSLRDCRMPTNDYSTIKRASVSTPHCPYLCCSITQSRKRIYSAQSATECARRELKRARWASRLEAYRSIEQHALSVCIGCDGMYRFLHIIACFSLGTRNFSWGNAWEMPTRSRVLRWKTRISAKDPYSVRELNIASLRLFTA